MTAGDAHARPAKDPVSQHSSMKRGGAHKPLPLAEELQRVDYFWKRNTQFSVCAHWQGCHATVDGLTNMSIWTAQTELSKLLKQNKTKGQEVGMAQKLEGVIPEELREECG